MMVRLTPSAGGEAGSRSRLSGRAPARRYAGSAHAVVFERADAVAETLDEVLAGWPHAVLEAPVEPAIHVSRRAGGYDISAPWVDEPVRADTHTAAACALVIELSRSVLSADPELLCLHCAAFELDGRLVLLAGTNRAGKSTIAARLGAAGARVVCDDILPIDTERGLGIALGVPPRLRLPLPPEASAGFVDNVARHTLTCDERYAYLQPQHLAPHGEALPIGAMILLDRQPGGPTGFASVDRATTLQHLLLRNLRNEPSALSLVDRLLALAADLPCWRLVYADFESASDILQRSFAAWPPKPAPLLNSPVPGDAAPQAIAPAQVDDIVYRRTPGITARALDGELFLVDGDNRSILHLNRMAAAVWALLEDPIDAAETAELLAEAFPEVAATRIRTDVDRLFLDLAAHGLVEGLEEPG